MTALNKCSFIRSLNYDGVSCLKKKELIEIINSLNKEYKLYLKKTGTKKELWDIIDNTLKLLEDPKKWDKCNEEWCWLKTCIKRDKETNKCYKKLIDIIGDKEIVENMLKLAFKPNKPKGKPFKVDKETGEIIDDAWLSTIDIRNIIKQLEIIFKDEFIFKGPIPIDTYKCTIKNKDWCKNKLINESINIDISNLKKKGIKYIGIVFNLDKHNESGSHWVSMFIDLKDNTIDYFDSAEEHKNIKDIPNDILNYIQYIKQLGEKDGIKFKIRYNKVQHQKKNSECGMYSIYFIMKRVLGEKFDNLVNNKNEIITDFQMNKLRKLLYK